MREVTQRDKVIWPRLFLDHEQNGGRMSDQCVRHKSVAHPVGHDALKYCNKSSITCLLFYPSIAFGVD